MVRLRVREIAESQGLNIQDLANKSGVAYSTVLDLWHDRVQQINKRTLGRISKALGVKPGELLDEDDQKNLEPLLAA